MASADTAEIDCRRKYEAPKGQRQASPSRARLVVFILVLFLPFTSFPVLRLQSTDNAVMVKATRSYQCHRCSRSFARLEHLQRHDRSRMSD